MTVFLSYSHQDSEAAEQIRDGLRRHGLEVWSDAAIKPGQGIIEKVGNALKAADSVVFVFGGSEQSPWTSLEAGMATAWNKIVIPVFTDADAEVPVLLRGLKAIDASDPKSRPEQIKELSALLASPPGPRSTSEALSAVREAHKAFEVERGTYEEALRERSLSLVASELLMATVSTVVAAFALVAVSNVSSEALIAITSGVGGALIAALLFYLFKSVRNGDHS